MDIQPPGAESAVWRAFGDGNLIAYGFTLMVFLDRLEALPEPLCAAQDFGLHLPARHFPFPDLQESQGRGTAGQVLRAVGLGRADLYAGGGVTCLPPPVGNPVQAGDARGWYQPRAPHAGQAPMPWLTRTFWATAICWASSLGVRIRETWGEIKYRCTAPTGIAQPG